MMQNSARKTLWVPVAGEEVDGEAVTLTGGCSSYYNAGVIYVEQERILTEPKRKPWRRPA